MKWCKFSISSFSVFEKIFLTTHCLVIFICYSKKKLKRITLLENDFFTEIVLDIQDMVFLIKPRTIFCFQNICMFLLSTSTSTSTWKSRTSLWALPYVWQIICVMMPLNRKKVLPPSEVFLEACQTSTKELFAKNSRSKAPS